MKDVQPSGLSAYHLKIGLRSHVSGLTLARVEYEAQKRSLRSMCEAASEMAKATRKSQCVWAMLSGRYVIAPQSLIVLPDGTKQHAAPQWCTHVVAVMQPPKSRLLGHGKALS